ncbi:hypothetical protein VP01_429g3 [Puccinia sorghi]|uniref:Uncharacterized protein n=1 Tax=Puccinia sorghi TaxID=27349 RepID=A0A0L6UQ57_9BASI|nr:hypothetical protein VP01_429g3 [Puccinia sorghi]
MLSGVALDAFDKLLAKFRYSLNQCFCRGQDNLTIDELGEKFETLNELRTTLLPSIKSQITTFPTNLALEPPLPSSKNDQQLKDFKIVRIHQILWKTKDLIQKDIWDLFETCLSLIRVWDRDEDARDLEFQETWALSRNYITRLAANSKLRWRRTARKLTEMLESFVRIPN